MVTSLLLEVGVEELPAIPFLSELPNIRDKFTKILKDYRLDCKFEFFYTPRRLVILSYNLPLKQEIQTLEFFGPSLEIAYKDGKPTQAALGFFKKSGILEEESSTISKGGKEVLYCKRQAPSLDSKELLQEILKEFLQSLNFGKTMRWGSYKESFIRPISWILACLGDEFIPLTLYGVCSQNHTFIHRNISYAAIEVASIEDYFQVLERGKVILDQNQRRSMILKQINVIEEKHSIEVEVDKDLLEEVVSITEYPTALFGKFDARFLEIPDPCIITSMKVNQRYFPTYMQNKLYHGFVMISNSLSEDDTLIIHGNTKVLRARLEDALFFYHNDLKHGLHPEKLQKINFVEGLGSMWDKTQREREIAKKLVMFFQDRLEISKDLTIIDKAIELSKADLLSEMVYEFTELQGIMGFYYTKHLGYPLEVSLAIKEQYLPNSEESKIPSNIVSAIVALSHKLDNLLGLFSLNKIPTGSKDPFALRRSANGIIKILLHFKLPFNLRDSFEALSPLYRKFDLGLLEDFILDRLQSILACNPSLLRAIVSTNERDLVKICQKLEALNASFSHQDKTLLTQTFKRLANITKEVTLDSDLPIDEERLVATEERELYERFKEIQNKDFKEDYEAYLQALLSLSTILDRFFDKVLINAPDVAFRNNRKHLVGRIYRAFLTIADIKEISF
ncbi:MAG: glycine--tRNA ligase subunit beta [Helicobacter sp.]|nr:glycine--tRNA ligase subunit beta [Helicobacter sp.]